MQPVMLNEPWSTGWLVPIVTGDEKVCPGVVSGPAKLVWFVPETPDETCENPVDAQPDPKASLVNGMHPLAGAQDGPEVATMSVAATVIDQPSPSLRVFVKLMLPAGAETVPPPADTLGKASACCESETVRTPPVTVSVVVCVALELAASIGAATANAAAIKMPVVPSPSARRDVRSRKPRAFTARC